jgi:long-subunit acyl-CoA synthetase (AMP-forming)
VKIQFNILDFLDRVEHVCGDRVGVVDEPDQPADSWGRLTWRQVAEHARALAAGLDALGVGRGERIAIVSHNSARLLAADLGALPGEAYAMAKRQLQRATSERIERDAPSVDAAVAQIWSSAETAGRITEQLARLRAPRP